MFHATLHLQLKKPQPLLVKPDALEMRRRSGGPLCHISGCEPSRGPVAEQHETPCCSSHELLDLGNLGPKCKTVDSKLESPKPWQAENLYF